MFNEEKKILESDSKKKNRFVKASIIEIDDYGDEVEITWKVKGLEIPVFSSLKFENRNAFYAAVNFPPGHTENLYGKSYFCKMFETSCGDLRIVPETLLSVDLFKEQCEELNIEYDDEEKPAVVFKVAEEKEPVIIARKAVDVPLVHLVKDAAKNPVRNIQKPAFKNFSESAKWGIDKKILKSLRNELQKVVDREHVKEAVPELYEEIMQCAKDIDGVL